jgi:hypothetical protein
MEDVMRRIGIVVALMMLLAPLSVTAQIMNDNFIFPVVTRTPGTAGTMWKTEVCVTNPWDTSLFIAGAFIQGGRAEYDVIEFPPRTTYCTQDLVKDWLLEDKWTGAFGLYAPPEFNTHTTRTAFAAIAKVYNDTPAGTFGTSVPVAQIVPEAWSMGDPLPIGVVSGVHNFGTPGVSGFRSAVGIFNPATFAQQIDILVLDSYGHVVWSKTVSVPGWTIKQYSVPQRVQFQNSAGIGINNGGASGTVQVFAYATVVDNRTGDGVFKPAMIFYENVLKSSATQEIKEAEETLMRKLFKGLLDEENPQIRRAGERMVPGPKTNVEPK